MYLESALPLYDSAQLEGDSRFSALRENLATSKSRGKSLWRRKWQIGRNVIETTENDAVAICPNILTDFMSIFTKVVEIVCWSNMKKTESWDQEPVF
jgi:hypothetical protein